MKRVLGAISLFCLLSFMGGRFAQAAIPGSISNLTAVAGTALGDIILTWTSPGSSGNTGTADGYLVRWSTIAPITNDGDFATATSYAQAWGPQVAGSAESQTASSLTNGTTYYWGIQAYHATNGTATWSTTGGINSLNSARAQFMSPLVWSTHTIVESSTSIKWAWIDITQEAGYRVFNATSSDNLSGDLVQDTTIYQHTGLPPNTTYQVFLQSFETATTLNSATTVQVTLAAIPTSLNSSTQATTSLDVAWNANNNPSGTQYDLERSTNGVDSWTVPFNRTTNNTETDTGLTANTTYVYRVRAYNYSDVLSTYSATLTTITLAASPNSLTSPSQTNTTLTLNWNDGGNPAGTQYDLERSTDGSSNWTVVSAKSTDTTITDNGLAELTSYYYRVRAFNYALVASSYSVSLTTQTEWIRPAAISSLNAAPGTNDGEVNLVWTAPGNDGASGTVTTYVLKYATFDVTSVNFDDGNVSQFNHVWGSLAAGGNPESRTITGLTPNDTYYFAIKGVDGAGQATWSEGANANRSDYAKDLDPPQPTGLTATPGDHQIFLNWTAGGTIPDLEGYWVERATANDFNTVVVLATVPAISVSTTDFSLANQTTYYYRVRAIDTAPVFLTSPYSTTASTVTLDTEEPASVTGFGMTQGASEGEILVSWIVPGDDGSNGNIVNGEYRIKVSTDAGTSWNSNDYTVQSATSGISGSTHSTTISGLTNGATYYGRIWVIDEASNVSPLSVGATNWAQGDVTPPAIINPVTPTASWHQIALSWTSPGDDGSSGTLTGSYEIAYTSAGVITNLTDFQNAFRQVAIATSVAPGTPESYTITGLRSHTTYYISIRAIDDSSNAGTISSSTDTYPTNSVPTAFNLIAPADNAVVNTNQPLLDWQDASDADTGQGDQVSYTISYSSSNGFEAELTTTTSGLTVSKLTPSALAEDKTIYWRVIVQDSDGNQIIGSPDPMRVRINVGNTAPGSFSLVFPTDMAITTTTAPVLDWGDSVDGDPGDTVSYLVEMSLNNSFSPLTLSSAAATSTFGTSNLTENVTYYWRVTATDSSSNTLSSTFWLAANGTDEAPLNFSLVSPTDDQRLLITTPTFVWQNTTDNDPGDAIQFKLTYSVLSNFLSSTTVTLSTTSYTLPTQSDNINLYWFVDAIDSDSLSTQSQETFHCYIDLTKEAAPAFSLLVPTDTAIISNLKPLFDWNDAVDPDPFDNVRYYIELSENDPTFTGVLAIPTGADSFFQPLSNLIDDTTYYWRVTSGGYQQTPPVLVDGSQTTSVVYSFLLDTVNVPPFGFGLLSPENNSLVDSQTPPLTWETSVDTDLNDFATYEIQLTTVSDFSTIITSQTGVTDTQWQVSPKLTENTSWYWRVIARDNDIAVTISSQSFMFRVPILTRLREPNGVSGSFSTDLSSWTLTWRATTENTNGTTATDLAGYNIYRALNASAVGDGSPFSSVSSTATGWIDGGVAGTPYFYMLRSFDDSTIESADSAVLQAGAAPTSFHFSSDGSLRLILSASAAAELTAPDDGVIKRIGLTENTISGKILKFYDIAIERETDNTAVTAFTFTNPITLSFSIAGLQSSARALGAQASSISGSETAIYWHNGVEFIKIGGSVSSGGDWVTLNTVRTGQFQVRQVQRATSFEVLQIWPKKIFTPNDDGVNDTINFVLENPKDSPTEGKIFNLQGAHVANLSNGSDGSSLVWDGQLTNGGKAPKGVYIYQIEADGQLFNGTLVVAR